jgi:hypothetical protein
VGAPGVGVGGGDPPAVNGQFGEPAGVERLPAGGGVGMAVLGELAVADEQREPCAPQPVRLVSAQVDRAAQPRGELVRFLRLGDGHAVRQVQVSRGPQHLGGPRVSLAPVRLGPDGSVPGER